MDWVFVIFFLSLLFSFIVPLLRTRFHFTNSLSVSSWTVFKDECVMMERILNDQSSGERESRQSDLVRGLRNLRASLALLSEVERSRGEIVFNAVRLQAAARGVFID